MIHDLTLTKGNEEHKDTCLFKPPRVNLTQSLKENAMARGTCILKNTHDQHKSQS